MIEKLQREKELVPDLVRSIHEGGKPEKQALNFINDDIDFRKKLKSFIRRNGGRDTDVLPVFNEALLALHGKIKSLPEQQLQSFSLWGFLFRTCKYCWYRHARERSKQRGLLQNFVQYLKRLVGVEKDVFQPNIEQLLQVEELIDQLPEPDKSILLMREMEISYQEIAEEFDIKESTCRVKHMRIKARLAGLIQKKFPDGI